MGTQESRDRMSFRKIVFFMLALLPLLVIGQTDEIKAEYEARRLLIEQLVRTKPDSALLLLNIQKEFVLAVGDSNLIGNQVYQTAFFYSYQTNATDSVIKYGTLAAEIFEAIGDFKMGARVNRGMGSTNFNLGNLEKASAHYLKAVELAGLAKDTATKVMAYGGLSSLEIALGHDVIALDYAFKASDLWDSMSNKGKANSNPRHNIATVYRHQGDFEKYFAIVNELLVSITEEGDHWSAAQWYNNIAGAYVTQKQLDNAKSALWSAIYHAKKANFKYALADAHATLGVTYVEAGMLDSAKFHIAQIDIAVPQIEEPSFLAEASSAKGQYYNAIGNKRKAIHFYEIALTTWETLGEIDNTRDVAYNLFELYRSMGNSKKALEKHLQYTSFKDSLLNKENIEAFKEAELRHEFDQERFTDSLQVLQVQYDAELAHQEEIVTEKQGKTMLMIWLGFLGIVVVLVTIALLRIRKQSLILNEKNIEIEEALDAKKMLLKELHHRVKNNFQIVSSLLELQGKEIEDEQARALTQEGQNRVKSMAYIHQKLYQNDDLLISMTEYIDTLVREISLMFGYNDVEINIDASGHKFDIDTAIPLGLIINELVTNAFKYGFAAEKRILDISILKRSENYELKVGDNGQGMAQDFDVSKAKSLGLRLVKRLSRQLQGGFSFDNSKGSIFTVLFKDNHGRALVE